MEIQDEVGSINLARVTKQSRRRARKVGSKRKKRIGVGTQKGRIFSVFPIAVRFSGFQLFLRFTFMLLNSILVVDKYFIC